MAALRRQSNSPNSAGVVGRSLFSTFFIALVSVLGASACSPKVEFETEAATHGLLRPVIPAAGVVQAGVVVEVRPAASQIVRSIRVVLGQRVAKGDVLAVLDDRELRLAVNEASAGLEKAVAQVRSATSDKAVAEKALRDKQTLVDAGYFSIGALVQTQAALERAQAEVAVAGAEVSRARSRLGIARQQLEDATLRAPFDGVVLQLNAVEGARTSDTPDKPAFVIASDLDHLVVVAQVSEIDIVQIHRGMAVTVISGSGSASAVSGRILSIADAPKGGRSSPTFPVEIALENRERRFRPGMSANVEFSETAARSVTKIPIEALYFVPPNYRPQLNQRAIDGLRRRGKLGNADAEEAVEMGMLFAKGRNRVFVLVRGKPEMRVVTIGDQSDRFVEVREGIRPGDAVVIATRKPSDA